MENSGSDVSSEDSSDEDLKSSFVPQLLGAVTTTNAGNGEADLDDNSSLITPPVSPPLPFSELPVEESGSCVGSEDSSSVSLADSNIDDPGQETVEESDVLKDKMAEPGVEDDDIDDCLLGLWQQADMVEVGIASWAELRQSCAGDAECAADSGYEAEEE